MKHNCPDFQWGNNKYSDSNSHSAYLCAVRLTPDKLTDHQNLFFFSFQLSVVDQLLTFKVRNFLQAWQNGCVKTSAFASNRQSTAFKVIMEQCCIKSCIKFDLLHRKKWTKKNVPWWFVLLLENQRHSLLLFEEKAAVMAFGSESDDIFQWIIFWEVFRRRCLL